MLVIIQEVDLLNIDCLSDELRQPEYETTYWPLPIHKYLYRVGHKKRVHHQIWNCTNSIRPVPIILQTHYNMDLCHIQWQSEVHRSNIVKITAVSKLHVKKCNARQEVNSKITWNYLNMDYYPITVAAMIIMFQQDGDASHTSNVTQSYLEEVTPRFILRETNGHHGHLKVHLAFAAAFSYLQV